MILVDLAIVVLGFLFAWVLGGLLLRLGGLILALGSAGAIGPLVLPAPVAAEVDYLLGVRFGEAARRAFLSDLAAQRYDVACLEAGDYRAVSQFDARYSDLGLGLADCSIVVLAERYGARRLLSFDERHFRAVAPLRGGAFELLPADL